MNTKNILFICGGAFDGVEKIIEKRVNQKGIGFGAEILSKSEMEQRNVLSQIQPHDLLKFGIIPRVGGPSAGDYGAGAPAPGGLGAHPHRA